MKQLTIGILKIFYRNTRAIFFVVFLPVGIFLLVPLLGLSELIIHDLPIAYTDFLLAGVIAFALLQTGIYTSAYSLIDYRRQQILKRLSVTPLTAGQFLFSMSIARFVVALVQTSLLVVLGMIFFGTKLSSWVVFLPVVVFLGNTIFLNLGYLIASFARDYEEGAPYTSIVGLSLIFLGDMFFSASNLPIFLQKVAEVLPLKPLSELLRYTILGVNSINPMRNLAILLAWLIVTTVVANTIFSKRAFR